jgi:hypothetical protein
MVWGGMIALSTIAELKADRLFKEYKRIESIIENGTVITEVAGIKILVRIASVNDEYYKSVFKFLLKYVKEGRPIDLAGRIEEYRKILNDKNAKEVLKALNENANQFSQAQKSRINKVLKKYNLLFE